jgi:hypothetical protein
MRKGILLLALVLAVALAVPAAAQPPSITFEPLRPTTLEPVRVTVRLLVPEGIDPKLRFSHVEGEKIVFLVGNLAGPNLPPASVAWTAEATVGPLKRGLYTVVVDSEQDLDFQRTFEVTEPIQGLALREEVDTVFSVTVDFEPPPRSNLRGTGWGVPLTRESGYFWFFDPDNVEVTVKILDGRPVNGRYWVFLASMTDLQLTVRVTQCPTSPLVGIPCVTREYRTEPGVNRNIIDVNFQGL